ncbi:MAG: FecR family protein [Myxococcales bacterium]
MKVVAKRRPAEYMNPELDPERAERIWRVIEAHQLAPAAASRALKLWALSATVIAAAGVWFWLSRSPHAELAAKAASSGDVIVTEGQGTALNLPDGSSVLLGQAAKLDVLRAVPSDIALRLEHGRVVCDVVHNPARPFAVEAAGIVVQVEGTHFSVEISPNGGRRVSVKVDRGRVEVKDRAGHFLATMTPGQSWSGIADLAPSPEPSAQPLAPSEASR